MIILGIDPGTHLLGYGLVEKDRHGIRPVDFGVIKTSPEKRAGERLEKIWRELDKIIETHSPELAAIEKIFFFKNQKSVIPVAEARGVILLTLAKHRVPVREYTPPEIKVAVTGQGKADKKQVQKMVRLILGLESDPHPDDAADALAVALCCAHERQISL